MAEKKVISRRLYDRLDSLINSFGDRDFSPAREWYDITKTLFKNELRRSKRFTEKDIRKYDALVRKVI